MLYLRCHAPLVKIDSRVEEPDITDNVVWHLCEDTGVHVICNRWQVTCGSGLIHFLSCSGEYMIKSVMNYEGE